MELLVLGGTVFLGRAVVAAALERGHRVTTYTRGISGAPPTPVTALIGDRTRAADLDAALDGRRFDAVVDTSGYTLASAELAAERLSCVDAYAYVSSLNAYRDWPPGPIPDESAATWPEAAEDYGPMKAASERALAGALGDRLLAARAGLIVGPYDDVGRIPWWLTRLAAGGRVVVPDALDQPIALVDARDLADWLVRCVEERHSGPVNATGPVGMTTYGGLLEQCAVAVGSEAELVPVAEEVLLAAGVEPWQHPPALAAARRRGDRVAGRHCPSRRARAAQPTARRDRGRHLALAPHGRRRAADEGRSAGAGPPPRPRAQAARGRLTVSAPGPRARLAAGALGRERTGARPAGPAPWAPRRRRSAGSPRPRASWAGVPRVS